MSHLARTQLRMLRKLLHQREVAAQAEIRAKTESRADEPYAELAGSVTDLGDDASADLIVDVDNAVISMQLATLHDIAAARERMKRSRYGICIDCEQEIDYARLSAYPTAKRCTPCESMHERTFATSPHSTL